MLWMSYSSHSLVCSHTQAEIIKLRSSMPTEPAQNSEDKPAGDQGPSECDPKTESSPSKARKATTEEGLTVKEQDSILKLELELVQERLRHRDGEINILLRSLKQERKRASRAEGALSAAGVPIRAVSPVSPDRVSPVRLSRNEPLQQSFQSTGETNAASSHHSQEGVIATVVGVVWARPAWAEQSLVCKREDRWKLSYRRNCPVLRKLGMDQKNGGQL